MVVTPRSWRRSQTIIDVVWTIENVRGGDDHGPMPAYRMREKGDALLDECGLRSERQR